MSELIIRFLIGGVVVSLFAIIEDILRTEELCRIVWGRAQFAFATLGLTISQHGRQYVATEAHSMILESRWSVALVGKIELT